MKKNSINKIFKLYFSKKELSKIQRAKIMIIGCGGLGSNIANMLIRTGFLNIILIDYDKVELKNLNRQQYYPNDIGKFKVKVLRKRLKEINPLANIYSINDIMNEEKLKKLIKKYNPDLIVEAVDKEWAKVMIFETALKMSKKVITASGLAGWGDVENIKIIRNKKYTIIGDLVSKCGCCSECNFNENKLHKTKSNCKMPLAPKVSAVAAMQADEVIRRILKYKND
ncbi:MAG: sulfur carrier protein ThiS adenylyltransferase ThiF [Elusimicrobiales bacterium]|nr:sulfur carrier protein ThiS adenylyltransferase ThiF [Elusimicrobiales bacterium]